MAAQKQETIELKVLRVASPGVLGQSQPLQVARPFLNPNAGGNLKQVDGFAEIQSLAAASADRFLAGMRSKGK